MNEVVQDFLQAYAEGREAAEGWLYAKALQQAQLDYSAAGLRRLDQLLKAIRERAAPHRQALQETPQGRNLCALIAFHLIEIVRRRTGAHLVWHDRASAVRALAPGARLPATPEARMVAMFPDQGVVLMPLAWVEAQLLGEPDRENATDLVAGLAGQVERVAPGVWWAAIEAVGKIASWQMMTATDDGTVLPLMLASTQPNTWVSLVSPLSSTDINAALRNGVSRLDHNPDGATWQVLAYDAITLFRGQQTDAVMVFVQTYGIQPLNLKIAFPYRPGGAGQAFQILDPTVVAANVEGDMINMLNDALERGIASVNWAVGSTWNALRSD